ncbi:MAG: M56 family metallopeptidase [Pseudomonadota bacterium]
MNPSWMMIEAALAQALVAALWQVAALTAAAALVLAALARASAAAQHAVGLLFMVAMVAVPGWQLVDSLQAAPMAHPLPASSAAGWVDAALPWAAAVPAGWQAPPWLAWAWAGGVLLMLARLGGGWWWLRALERPAAAVPAPAAWQRRAQRLCAVLGITRPVQLRLLPRGHASPFTARAWRPIVWLPLALLTKLAPEQVEALLAHELAHIRRLDWLWNGLQCTIEALLFFHPGIWWLGRRVRLAREQACDDLAAAACGDPLRVAEALAALEGLRADPPPTLALAAGGGGLQRRVAHLLAAGQPATPRWGLAAIVAALLCAGGVWAAQATAASSSAPYAAPAAATAPAPDPWWSEFGDSIRIRITDRQGEVRDYHAWTGANGQRHESYRVDGQPAPLTPDVRAWIEAHRQAPAPPPPPTAAPAAPADLPAPPALPTLPSPPPEPPRLNESPVFLAVLAAVQQDAGAVAALGSPIRLADDCGPCRIDDHSASLMLSASGPKGQARVHVVSHLVDGQWQLQTLDLRPGLASRLGLVP